jgi:hypothetical protein
MSCSTISTPKLTMRIVREGDTTLRATILQMDERARKHNGRYTASNGFTIQCYGYPQLGISGLYIRGEDRSEDERTVSRSFRTRAEREEYITRMTAALQEWATNAPVFRSTTDGTVITRSFVHADVTFVKLERALVMQVTRMDEAFRSNGPEKAFTASNGITIRSYASPCLHRETVCLWGEIRSGDHIVNVEDFSSNTERDTYLSRVLAALAEWDTQYEAWKPAAPAVCCHHCTCSTAAMPPSEFILTV